MFLLISSYIADLIFGDPEWLPHPVRIIGKLINILDERLNRSDSICAARIKGLVVTSIVVGMSGSFAYLFLKSAERLNPLLGNLAWVYLGYTSLSVKDLLVKARTIFEKLISNSLVEARIKLSQIVGRDTQKLSEEKIIKATIESVAESTNDGIIAPLFYLILGGPVLAIVYKAINTLDSMVGYKNERYRYFGWFSAKLDDVANFFPARITGLLIPSSSLILRKNFKDSFKIMLRDGRKHSSPNSGISEAAMAGSLGIRLGGGAYEQGKFVDRKYIGEEKDKIDKKLITEAIKISLTASILMLIIGVIVRWII